MRSEAAQKASWHDRSLLRVIPASVIPTASEPGTIQITPMEHFQVYESSELINILHKLPACISFIGPFLRIYHCWLMRQGLNLRMVEINRALQPVRWGRLSNDDDTRH